MRPPMTPDAGTTPEGPSWLRATELLSPAIRQRLESLDTKDVVYFTQRSDRYHALSATDLLRATEHCLRNLGPLHDSLPNPVATPDADLRILLVPELCERLRPGTRDPIRRLTTTRAERDLTQPSIWRRSKRWSAERDALYNQAAQQLRQSISRLADEDTATLTEKICCAIATSTAAESWGPTAPVYESAFTYSLVPALALRVRDRHEELHAP